jgi:hypothetical protein
MPNDAFEICGASTAGSTLVFGVSGAFAGLGVGIWIMVDFVQPALASTSLTSAQASGITAAIALFGGLEGFIAAGAAAGAVSGAALGCVCGSVAALCHNNGYSSLSMFSRNDARNTAASPTTTVDVLNMA